jgi:tRNA (mo5U34)-methyltransferase
MTMSGSLPVCDAACDPAFEPVAPGACFHEPYFEQAFAPFFAQLQASALAPWLGELRQRSAERLCTSVHGELPAWLATLRSMPRIPARRVDLHLPQVRVESETALDHGARAALRRLLAALHPWRKGPFCLHGIQIDAEWRSDWKWARLAEAITPLAGRLVLDVGCGNGYYAYRALGAGARLVLGIDPTLRFVMQFLAVQQLIREPRVAVLPLADSDLPAGLTGFDTVFSMGVLYHRRDSAQHLGALCRLLRPGGELVLETLVLNEPGQQILVPAGRYAMMRNVHAIPSLNALLGWLRAAGLRRPRILDVTPTSTDEQRATDWMRFQSLADFLDPSDPRRTIEGHPAPVRAIIAAERSAGDSAPSSH